MIIRDQQNPNASQDLSIKTQWLSRETTVVCHENQSVYLCNSLRESLVENEDDEEDLYSSNDLYHM